MSAVNDTPSDNYPTLQGASPQCLLCHAAAPLTFHHLIPKTCHRNKWFRKNFTLDDMRNRGVTLCRACHSFVHKKFSEKELGRELNTAAKLQANDTIQKYLKWARKRRP